MDILFYERAQFWGQILLSRIWYILSALIIRSQGGLFGRKTNIQIRFLRRKKPKDFTLSQETNL